MTEMEQRAIMNLCLQAALADGDASSAERGTLHQLAARLQQTGFRADLPNADLRARAQAIREVARDLQSQETARTAYEMAVAVCQADGPATPAENWFLQEIHRELGLDTATAVLVQEQATALATAPLSAPAPAAPGFAVPLAAAPALPVELNPPADAVAANVPGAELDRTILHTAILAGALELLPDTLATMAIVPVQMQLVYRVGKAHGYELDRGHITDLLATVGVGLAAQVVEGFAERAVRSLVGHFAGGLVRSLAGQVTSSGMAFATTYALGQLARQYYAGGRRFGAIELRSLYNSMLSQGRSLQGNYRSQIREQADRVNLSSLTSLLRGRA